MSRRMKILFGLSLVFNLLIIGGFLGGMAHYGMRRDHGHAQLRMLERASGAPIEQFIRRLPAAHQAMARAHLDAVKDQLDGRLTRMHQARQQVLMISGATELDQVALTAQLQVVAAESAALRTLAHQVMIEVLTDLPTAERQKMVERAGRFMRHMPGAR